MRCVWGCATVCTNTSFVVGKVTTGTCSALPSLVQVINCRAFSEVTSPLGLNMQVLDECQQVCGAVRGVSGRCSAHHGVPVPMRAACLSAQHSCDASQCMVANTLCVRQQPSPASTTYTCVDQVSAGLAAPVALVFYCVVVVVGVLLARRWSDTMALEGNAQCMNCI